MSAPGERSEATKSTVLLIDEDPKAGQLVRSALGSARLQVLLSTRVEEGLRLAARHKPRLVLMESRFRGGDGILLAGKLVAAPATSASAVAIFTTERSLVRRLQALQLGVAEYIDKPISPERLKERVESLFARLARGRPAPTSAAAAEWFRARVEGLVDAGHGTLELSRGQQTATLEIAGGQLKAAQFGPHAGLEAFDAMARVGDWDLPGGVLAPLSSLADEPLFGGDDEEHTVLDPLPRTAMLADVGTPSTVDLAFEVMVPDELLTSMEDEDSEPETDPDPYRPGSPASDEPAPDAAGAAPPPRPRRVTGPSRPSPRLSRPPTGSTVEALPRAPAAPRAAPTRLEAAAERRPIAPPPESTIAPAQVQPPPATGEVTRSQVDRLLDRFGRGLLMATGDRKLQRAVLDGAAAAGFESYGAASAVEAYRVARQRRPAVIISDAKLPDAPGHELLGAVRCDYLIRETAFLLAPGDELARSLGGRGSDSSINRLFSGVNQALAPRAELLERLGCGSGTEGGWVEPIGVTTLLRMVGASGFTGSVRLRYHEARNAALIFTSGNLCGVTVNSPQTSVGPLAMLHLLAYEWSNYLIASEEPGIQVPLGELPTLIENAGRQNNALLERIYHEGVVIEGVAVDRSDVDTYLRSMPAPSLARMMRVVDGEAPATLVSEGVATPGAMKSLLHDMRRKAVVRAESLKPVRDVPTGSAEPFSALDSARPARARWLVVALSTLATVTLALALLFLHRQLGGPADVTTPPVVQPDAGGAPAPGAGDDDQARQDHGERLDGGATPEAGGALDAGGTPEGGGSTDAGASEPGTPAPTTQKRSEKPT